MTRETKVGLVIGLGVILLVGIIVSEYFVRDESLQEQPLAAGMPDFNNNTNQSPLHQRTADGQVVDPYARNGAPATAVEHVADPPVTQTPAEPGVRPGPRSGPPRVGADVALPGMAVGQRERQEDTTPQAGHTPPIAQGHPAPGEHTAQRPVRNPVPTRPGQGLAAGGTSDNVVDTTQPIEPLPTAPPAPTTVEHVVAEQETLTQIARRYYNGDGNMWRSIRDANPDLVGPEGQVRAGATLRIPMRSQDAFAGRDSDTPRTSDAVLALTDNDRPEVRRGRRVEVRDGDTLSAIAAEHLGSANDWQLILDANPDVLTDPSRLRAGMRLRIPAVEEADVAELANNALSERTSQPERRAQTPEQPERTAPPAGRTYTVVAGDSLYRIAEKTLGSGNRFNELYEANKDQLDSADAIREGMVLRLPASSQANAQ